MHKRIKRQNRYAKLPEGAVLVNRSSRWGNPFKLIEQGGTYTREESMRLYKPYILEKIKEDPAYYDLTKLKGKDLACTCDLEVECHADFLLELANSKP